MKLLIADEDPELSARLAERLRKRGDEVVCAGSTRAALDRMEVERFDLVLTELAGDRTDAWAVLREARERWPTTRVAVMTRTGRVDSVVDAMRAGAFDFLEKPLRGARLRQLVERARAAPAPPSAPAGKRRTPDRDLAEDSPPRRGPGTGHLLGEGRLERLPQDGRVQKVLRIDATGAPSNFLARLLIGSYITGQDQVLVTARGGLTGPQRAEVRSIVDRILGMTVVGDGANLVEIQNFIDPGKYPLPRLLHHVERMLREQLEACRTALTGDDPDPLPELESTEDDIDRFYLLMVRQLLLSSESPQIARSIDVESHHYQLGYRLVAKVLEVTGDLVHGIGREVQHNLAGLRRISGDAGRPLVEAIARLEARLSMTMEALVRLSALEANAILNDIARAMPRDLALCDTLARRIPDRHVAISAQRIVSNLEMLTEMLVIINEVTINRCVEPEVVDRRALGVAPLGTRGPARGEPFERGPASSGRSVRVVPRPSVPPLPEPRP